MEKHSVGSFYGFGIFVFFLYFMKASSVPSATRTQNIIDVMKGDTELCQMPKFLYENNVTEICHNEKYPEKIVRRDFTMRDTFLCLAFYDTMYKLCQNNEVNRVLNNATTFYSNIQNFSPEENQDDQAKFCEKIKGITFSYKKLKPLLSHIRFDNSHVCYVTCVDMEGKFIPLCATLGWSTNIDMKHASADDEKQKGVQSGSLDKQLTVDNPKQNKEELSSKPTSSKGSNEVTVVSNNNVTKKEKADSKNDSETQKNNPANAQNSEDTPTQVVPPKSIAKSPDANVKQNTADNSNSSPTNKDKEVGTSAEKVNDPELLEKPVKEDNVENPKESVDINVDTANNGEVANRNDAIDDVKTSTISENTQDHDISANQDDWSHMEDDKLPNDPNDGPDPPMDPVDQGQSIPEQPEQREIVSPYHTLRTDEEYHFFTVFIIISLISIAAYIGYHNKQKILAIVLEGRRSRNSRGRRRPSTANYRKLDCTLEEAVTSQCNANVTHVIY